MEIEIGANYTVYTPDLSDYFALNNPGDPKFVGYVKDITGLDDAEVRENFMYNNAGDGAWHGPFWFGRRPWTISGFVWPTTPLASRSAAERRIVNVMGQAMRSNGWLFWTPSDGIQKFIQFRKQQPTRTSIGQSNVQRNFLIAGVSSDYLIQQAGTPLTAGPVGVGSTLTVTNAGDAPAKLKFTVTGGLTGLSIINNTNSKQFTLNSILGDTDTIVADLTKVQPSIVLNTSTSADGDVDPYNTNWDISADPGVNHFQIVGTSGHTGAASLSVSWRNAWL